MNFSNENKVGEYGLSQILKVGLVEDATIKNLTMDGASISGENGLCGTVAATAYNVTCKNVTVIYNNK